VQREFESNNTLREHGSPVCLNFHTTETEKRERECGLAAGTGEARHGNDANLKSHFYTRYSISVLRPLFTA